MDNSFLCFEKYSIYAGELFPITEKHNRLKLFIRFLSVLYFGFLFFKTLTVRNILQNVIAVANN